MSFLQRSLLLSLHQTGTKYIAINSALNFSASTIRSKASLSSLLKFNTRNFLSTVKCERRAFGSDTAARGTGAQSQAAVTARREALGNGLTGGLVFQAVSSPVGC